MSMRSVTIENRVRCIGCLPGMSFAAAPPGGDGAANPRGRRSVLFPGRTSPDRTPVYRRTDLGPGCRIPGPAVVEEYGSTTVAYPSFDLSVDAHGNLMLRGNP